MKNGHICHGVCCTRHIDGTPDHSHAGSPHDRPVDIDIRHRIFHCYHIRHSFQARFDKSEIAAGYSFAAVAHRSSRYRCHPDSLDCRLPDKRYRNHYARIGRCVGNRGPDHNRDLDHVDSAGKDLVHTATVVPARTCSLPCRCLRGKTRPTRFSRFCY